MLSLRASMPPARTQNFMTCRLIESSVDIENLLHQVMPTREAVVVSFFLCPASEDAETYCLLLRSVGSRLADLRVHLPPPRSSPRYAPPRFRGILHVSAAFLGRDLTGQGRGVDASCTASSRNAWRSASGPRPVT